MKTPLFAASTLLLSALAALPASATPFDPSNQISFNGFNTYNSTTVTFSGPFSTGGATGAFSAFNGASTTFNTLNYTQAPSSNPLFSSTATNGSTLAFYITSFSTTQSTPSLDITGLGYYLLNGTRINGGNFELTSQGAMNSTVSFSDTNSIAQAPEPASLALLGTGLLGAFGAVRRRRS